MKVLFDTNVILDIILEREPFYVDSSMVLKFIDDNFIHGYVSATSITDIYYLSRKELGHEKVIALLIDLINVLEVVGVDKEIILKALFSGFKDFEDSIQIFSTKSNKLDAIVTRNV